MIRFLEGRHAVVTGGGGGIGAEIATTLAEAGADITLMGRTAPALEAAAEGLSRRSGVRAGTVVCDVADAGSVEAAFARAVEAMGAPAVLVNNAGLAEGAAFLDTTPELLNRMLAVNLAGAFLCTRQVLPAMLEAGYGRVINIASTAGLRGYSHVTAYCASKHGLIGFTRALARETAKQGVTVNAVCPGYTDTPMTERTIADLREATGRSRDEAERLLTRTLPSGRLILPAEVANAVAWLCQPGASAVTGQAIVVAAGEVEAG